MIGELFPGRKLSDEGSQSGDGQEHRPVELDLESGVVRLAPPPGKRGEQPEE